jgi:DNA (cytosine-5)-methyltransferase 1
LFSGCGGISCGLEMAGFRILAGVDVEPSYLCSFAHNFPKAAALDWNLSETDPQVLMDKAGIKAGELDLLAGGPPCQGFSKNVPRSQREKDSSNNRLVKTFLTYCEALRPKAVLIENVAEMKNGFDRSYTDEISRRLTAAGYSIDHAVLNAADFGVPQRRRRTFFLAYRGKLPVRFPQPTHVSDDGDNTPTLLKVSNHVKVWEAIGDLPSLVHGEGEESAAYSRKAFSDFQKEIRNGNATVKNHRARKLQPVQFARLSSIVAGQGLRDLPAELRPRSGYSGAYGRLTKGMVAPTITRWVFHPGSGRYGHPVDPRVITIREAARLQGFPDHFEFVGTYTQQAGQVGNAVPPLLARQIGREILRQLA